MPVKAYAETSGMVLDGVSGRATITAEVTMMNSDIT